MPTLKETQEAFAEVKREYFIAKRALLEAMRQQKAPHCTTHAANTINDSAKAAIEKFSHALHNFGKDNEESQTPNSPEEERARVSFLAAINITNKTNETQDLAQPPDVEDLTQTPDVLAENLTIPDLRLLLEQLKQGLKSWTIHVNKDRGERAQLRVYYPIQGAAQQQRYVAKLEPVETFINAAAADDEYFLPQKIQELDSFLSRQPAPTTNRNMSAHARSQFTSTPQSSTSTSTDEISARLATSLVSAANAPSATELASGVDAILAADTASDLTDSSFSPDRSSASSTSDDDGSLGSVSGTSQAQDEDATTTTTSTASDSTDPSPSSCSSSASNTANGGGPATKLSPLDPGYHPLLEDEDGTYAPSNKAKREPPSSKKSRGSVHPSSSSSSAGQSQGNNPQGSNDDSSTTLAGGLVAKWKKWTTTSQSTASGKPSRQQNRSSSSSGGSEQELQSLIAADDKDKEGEKVSDDILQARLRKRSGQVPLGKGPAFVEIISGESVPEYDLVFDDEDEEFKLLPDEDQLASSTTRVSAASGKPPSTDLDDNDIPPAITQEDQDALLVPHNTTSAHSVVSPQQHGRTDQAPLPRRPVDSISHSPNLDASLDDDIHRILSPVPSPARQSGGSNVSDFLNPSLPRGPTNVPNAGSLDPDHSHGQAQPPADNSASPARALRPRNPTLLQRIRNAIVGAVRNLFTRNSPPPTPNRAAAGALTFDTPSPLSSPRRMGSGPGIEGIIYGEDSVPAHGGALPSAPVVPPPRSSIPLDAAQYPPPHAFPLVPGLPPGGQVAGSPPPMRHAAPISSIPSGPPPSYAEYQRAQGRQAVGQGQQMGMPPQVLPPPIGYPAPLPSIPSGLPPSYAEHQRAQGGPAAWQGQIEGAKQYLSAAPTEAQKARILGHSGMSFWKKARAASIPEVQTEFELQSREIDAMLAATVTANPTANPAQVKKEQRNNLKRAAIDMAIEAYRAWNAGGRTGLIEIDGSGPLGPKMAWYAYEALATYAKNVLPLNEATTFVTTILRAENTQAPNKTRFQSLHGAQRVDEALASHEQRITRPH